VVSQSPPHEPSAPPRAAAYGRGNQAAGRYQAGAPRRPHTGTGAAPAPIGTTFNRRRFWLLTVAFVLALGLGAATLTAVFASPVPVALTPVGPAPASTGPAGPTASTPTVAPTRTPGWDAAQDRPAPGPQATRSTAAGTGTAASPTTATPAGAPATAEPDQATTVYYKNCGQARKAGAAPILATEPGYSAKLDADGDGVACEKGKD
jgi:hypothetical protein